LTEEIDCPYKPTDYPQTTTDYRRLTTESFMILKFIPSNIIIYGIG